MQKIEQLFSRPDFWAIFVSSFLLLIYSLFFSAYPYQVVIISLSTILLVTLIVRPFLSYALVMILLHLTYLQFRFGKSLIFSVAELFMILTLFLWLFSRFAGIAGEYKKIPIDTLLFIFFSLAMLSLLWSHDFNSGTYHISILFVNLLFSFILTLSVVNNHKHLNIIIWIVIILGIIDSFVCFFSVYTYPDYETTPVYKSGYLDITMHFNDSAVGKRGHSFAHPLTTAFWLNFALILSFGKFITLKGRRKILLGLAMFLMLTAHLTTLSKGPLIALTGGLIFLFYFIKPIRKVITISIIILICTIIASFIFAHITDIEKVTRYTTHQLSSGEDSGTSTGSRLKWWGTSIQKSLENFGLGVGIGGIPQYLVPPTFHPHSVYMSVFGELGFAGLFLLLFIYLLALKSYFGALRQCKNEYYKRILLVYIGGYIALLISIMSDYNYIIQHVWWYIGFGFAIARVAQESPEEHMDEDLPFYKNRESIITTFRSGHEKYSV